MKFSSNVHNSTRNKQSNFGADLDYCLDLEILRALAKV